MGQYSYVNDDLDPDNINAFEASTNTAQSYLLQRKVKC